MKIHFFSNIKHLKASVTPPFREGLYFSVQALVHTLTKLQQTPASSDSWVLLDQCVKPVSVCWTIMLKIYTYFMYIIYK